MPMQIAILDSEICKKSNIKVFANVWVQRVLKETTKIYNLDKTIAEYNRMRWDIRSLVKCLCNTR